jgi:hypothetical protein
LSEEQLRLIEVNRQIAIHRRERGRIEHAGEGAESYLKRSASEQVATEPPQEQNVKRAKGSKEETQGVEATVDENTRLGIHSLPGGRAQSEKSIHCKSSEGKTHGGKTPSLETVAWEPIPSQAKVRKAIRPNAVVMKLAVKG